jgi:hypothetical protein
MNVITNIGSVVQRGFSSLLLLLALCMVLASCTDGGQMRCDLANLQARNEADSLLTDSLLALSLTKFFDSHGTTNERLQAHYLLARTWTDLGLAPRALEAYHTAAEQADTTALDSLGHHWLSRIYGQMGEILYNYQLPYNALDAYNSAIRHAYKAHEPLVVTSFYSQKSKCFYDLNLLDSAIAVYETAAQQYRQAGDTLSANICLGGLSYEYMRKQRYNEARECLIKFQYHSYLSNETMELYENWKLLYYYWGYYYIGTGQVDAALPYLYKELQCSSNPNNRLLAYQGLYQAYDLLGKPDSVQKYAILYAETNDYTNMLSTSSALLSMHHLYDYNRIQAIASHKTIEAEMANNRLLWLSLFCFLILASALFLIAHIRNCNRIACQRMEAKYANDIMMYNKAKADLYSRNHENKEKLKQALSEIDSLKKSLALVQNDLQAPDQWGKAEVLLSSMLINYFHQAAVQAKMMPDAAWNQLREMCNEKMPRFMDALMHFGYELNLVDTEICLLTKLRFLPSEICNLIGISPSALSKRRKRLLKNLFEIDGSAVEFDKMIRSIGE